MVFVLELLLVVVVPVVVLLLLLLVAELVAVAELKLNFLPLTVTVVTGAFPNLKVTLVAELGIVKVCDVLADKVPCQVVEPPTVTDIQLLPVAANFTVRLLGAFFISQVDPDVVALSCLKVAVVFFLEDDFFFADEELLDELEELLPDTLTELLSTFCLAVEWPLFAAATQMPTKTARTTTTIPVMGIKRRSWRDRSSTFRCCERVSGLLSLTLSTYSCVCVLGSALSNCFNSSAPSKSTISAYCLMNART